MFRKRYIALFGALLICLGCIILGTAHHFGQAVAGMAIAGAGAGTGELTGLAGYVNSLSALLNGELTWT